MDKKIHVKDRKNWPRESYIRAVPGRTGYPCTYPAGFGKIATYALGCTPSSRVVHVCGGCADMYNDGCNTLYGRLHYRIDNDPAVRPDVLMDVRGVWPQDRIWGIIQDIGIADAAIVDPDYSPEWAAMHAGGAETWPGNLKQLTLQAFRIVKEFGRVGVLHWEIPSLGPGYELMEKIQVLVNRQKDRWFTVWARRLDKETRDAYYPPATMKWDKKTKRRLIL